MLCHYRWLSFAVLPLATLVLGCSPTNNSQHDADHSDSHDHGAQAQATAPDVAVTQFLNAVRAGDQDKATSMLTTKARDEMAKADMVVQPPGSPSASFSIGQVKDVPQHNGAHVTSTWTDVTPTGEEKTYDITWIVRQEKKQWRVAGMATKLFEDQPPLILNFEDPADMQQQVMAADQELARRNEEGNGEIRQASRPDGNSMR